MSIVGTWAEASRLFHDFRPDDHVPADHLLRRIDVLVDLKSDPPAREIRAF